MWFEANKQDVEFRIVYIREAHPSDGWQMPVNVRQGVVYEEPETIAERKKVAEDCINKLGIEIPAVIDGMDNAFMKAYNSWPNRVYIIGGDGIVHFKGAWGPGGVSRVKFEEPLKQLLELPGKGRFTAHKPSLAVLDAKPLGNADLSLPTGLAPVNVPDGFYAEARRTKGPAFEIDVPATLTRGREILGALGLPEGGVVREDTLVAVNDAGEERDSKRSRLFRLRYRHFVGNAALSQDRIDLIFDKKGLLGVRGRWHRIQASKATTGEARSSLDAAQEAKLMKSVARLVYSLQPDGDGARYVPVYRLIQGQRVVEVDLHR